MRSFLYSQSKIGWLLFFSAIHPIVIHLLSMEAHAPQTLAELQFLLSETKIWVFKLLKVMNEDFRFFYGKKKCCLYVVNIEHVLLILINCREQEFSLCRKIYFWVHQNFTVKATKMSTLVSKFQSSLSVNRSTFTSLLWLIGEPKRPLVIPKDGHKRSRLILDLWAHRLSIQLTSFSSFPRSSPHRCLRNSSRPRAGSLQSFRPCGQSSTRLRQKRNTVKNTPRLCHSCSEQGKIRILTSTECRPRARETVSVVCEALIPAAAPYPWTQLCLSGKRKCLLRTNLNKNYVWSCWKHVYNVDGFQITPNSQGGKRFIILLCVVNVASDRREVSPLHHLTTHLYVQGVRSKGWAGGTLTWSWASRCLTACLASELRNHHVTRTLGVQPPAPEPGLKSEQFQVGQHFCGWKAAVHLSMTFRGMQHVYCHQSSD